MLHQVFDLVTPDLKTPADLFFVGDEQEGAEGFRTDAWECFKRAWKASRNPYMLHMGDVRDWLRPSLRCKVDAVIQGDGSAKRMLDGMVMKGLEESIRRLEFAKGRIVGMHQGHHDYEFQSGANATMLMATALETLNLGWVACTRLRLVAKGRGHADGVVTLASSHGNAAGKNTTAVAQSMESSFRDMVVDLKVQGHACRSDSWIPHTYRIPRRRGAPGEETVMSRHLLVGGFCDGYTDGWSTRPLVRGDRRVGGQPLVQYPERRNMVRQPVGWGVARIGFTYSAEVARSRSLNARERLVSVEVVNQNPTLCPDGLYR